MVAVFASWDAARRRQASMASTLAGVALMGLAFAATYVGGSQTDTFLLAVLVLLVAALAFQALVVLSGLRAASPTAASGAGAWEAPALPAPSAPAPAPPAPAGHGSQLTLKCTSCATVFDVTDTGERPLRHTCPGCGAQGELTEADIGPAPAAMGSPITLKCSSCGTVFDVHDTGARPLHHTCPGCGAEGVLREEDLGPAEAPAEAPAPAAAKPAPRPGAKTVKTLKLRCKSCQTVFTLRDQGERPLYHECPGCKATGVLR